MDIKIILIILSLYSLASTITYIVYIVKYHKALKKTCSSTTNTIYIDNKINPDIKNKYQIYYNNDFYNKFDLVDNYGQQIIIYSINLDGCYQACEENKKCYGFTKYKNYCYLKGSYDLSKKNNKSGSLLAVKKI
jgi:hypothetical protein